MKKIILFIQLPLLDHTYSYINGNIDYAPATLAAYINKNLAFRAKSLLLPHVLSQFGSDNLIVDYITKIRPDIICFTNYLWNCERHLAIAQKIKNQTNSIIILFGGPEIHQDSFVCSEPRNQVDLFIVGEGEWFFDLYFTFPLEQYTTRYNNNFLIIQPNDSLKPVDHICEPFTEKYLNSMIDGSIYLEMTRGCPYQCAYCYYSKNYHTVRELPFEILVKALKQRNIKEIYILSPTFNKSKDFKSKLENLAAMKHGIKLHTEMRATGINNTIARLLYRAGFRSLEVGLQTYSKNALNNINRKSSPLKEIKGMRALVKAGIDLKIGIIPALPGDTPLEFRNTIDMLVANGLGDYIELYPLMVLPGTAIRDFAQSNYVYQDRPPYYVISNQEFSFEDMQQTKTYLEELTGFSHSLFQLPDLSQSSNGLYTRGVAFNGDDRVNWNMFLYKNYIQTNVFSFFITLKKINTMYTNLLPFLQNVTEQELFNIILICDEIINEEIILDILAKIKTDNFYSRLHIYNEWQEGLRFRFYQLIKNPGSFNQAFENYSLIEPVLHITNNNYADLSHSDDVKNMFIPAHIYPLIKKYLENKYHENPEMLSFERKADQVDFYQAIDFDFVDVPFELRVLKLS